MAVDLPFKRVTLIRPPIAFSKSSYSSPVTPALALAYLGSSLKQSGVQVHCIDAVGEAVDRLTEHPLYECWLRGLSFDEIIERIPKDTQLIGLSCMFSQEWLVTKDLIETIEKYFPSATLIVGGEHVSALPEFVLNECPAIDACCLGEGEETLVDFVKNFTKSPEKVDGIVFRKNGKLYRTASRKRVREIGKIPPPDWNLVPIRSYHEYGACNGINTGISMPILATRGCPYQCTFCSNPTMWGTRYSVREPADVINEIERYVEKYQATNIEFYDLTAIIHKKWIVEFCELYQKRGLKVAWTLPSGTRSEALDTEVLGLLAKTNCRYLVYAAESGSKSTLDKIKKKINQNTFVKSMCEAKRVGLVLRCNLMLGFPTERRTDIFRTILFQVRLAWIGVDDAPLYLFSPYPGSELFRDLVASGRIRRINDEYFLGLLSQIDLKQAKSYNYNVSARELALYRLVGMSLFYGISYLLRPQRIWRTLKNVLVEKLGATVFEQRLIEGLRNKSRLRMAKE